MTNITGYTTSDIVNRIASTRLALEQHYNRINNIIDKETNYPPFNQYKVSDTEERIDLALAGFTRKELSVYTKNGKLHVEGKKENKENKDEKIVYVHKGLAYRNFMMSWSLASHYEVNEVNFVDGLLSIRLIKKVPEEYQRKDYL